MFNIHLSKLEVMNWPTKIVRRKTRILRKLPVAVGPFYCDIDFPLGGGRVYLDNLVTAALWC